MAVRVTSDEVAQVIQVDTDLWNDALITNASVLVDRLATLASSDTSEATYLSSDQLTQIELYIAAHLYALLDPQPISESAGRASNKYMGSFGIGLKATYWGQMALVLDTSGLLERISTTKIVGGIWLGKTTPNDADS